MKKLTTLIAILLLCATTLFAQAPEKFTYQAVVRNASNTLVTNTLVGVRVSILQGSATGNGVYVETQMPSTNANGLITLNIGDGNVVFGSFAGIDWSAGPYFLKTEIDPSGGNSYSVTTTQQLMSVPYALYAKEAGNAFSGDYNDLTNRPTIPTVPTDVSAFTNDAGYITMDSIPTIPTVPTAVSAFTNDVGYLTGYTETDPQFTAWDKNYNDLTNTPTIPTVPTNVSAFTNDAGYLTEYTETDPQFNAWDKDYNDLINTPTIPTVPTNVSAFTNDAGYLTSFTEQQVLSISNDTLFLTGGSFVKLPAGFDGDYNSLTNKPVIPTVPTNVSAFSNDACYLTGYTETDPQFTAWDKNYNDLTNTPTIPTVPTNISAFTNDVGYLTSFTEQQVLSISNDTLFLTGGSFVKLPAGFDGDYNSLTNKPVIPTVPTNISAFTNDAGYITTYTETDPQFNAWDKDYNDLINTPTIPTVPTNVSAFTNDAGYLTSFTEQQVLSISNDTLFLTGGSFVKLPAGFDGDYNSLTNRPVIPTVPTNVSAFTNDAGYIAGYTETDPQFNAWDKDYNDLINTPTIPTVPTNVSAFTNDAGYITMDSVPAIPTNVSAFTNDAGYLTDYSEQQILTISNDTIFLSGGSFVKLPAAAAGFSGDYNDLTNKPTIPTVPTNVSAFTNDAGYLTAANVQEAANIPTNVSAFANDAGYLTEYTETDPQFNAWDKDYNDLINTPTIPTVPTNVSAFTNDAGYITSYTETDPQFNAWDKDYNDLTNKPVLFDGDYNSLTNRPVIPMVPTNVSAFTNDAGYITGYTETDPQFNAWDKDYNDLINTPTIPTVPTNVSAFENDAQYITAESIPTNVSVFENDAHYITEGELQQTVNVINSTIESVDNAMSDVDNTIDSLRDRINELEGNNTPPTVMTTGVADVSYLSATVNGSVIYIGGAIVAAKGFCYDTVMHPTVENATVSCGSGSGEFSANLLNLKSSKTYYVRAYATNMWGTNYGEEKVFTTLTELTPSVEITTPSVIAHRSITCNGDVTDQGTYPVSARGFCYAATPDPVMTDSHVHAGNGTGPYTAVITGLEPESTYYVRAYAVNAYGVSYSSSLTLTTLTPTAPVVTTDSVSMYNECMATVVSDGGANVTQRGFCYDTLPNPTLENNVVYVDGGEGEFAATLSGLPIGKLYFVRAFATNAKGTTYGNQFDFYGGCDMKTLTDYDGNVYNTVLIGNQCWMKENLKTTHYSDGWPIEEGGAQPSSEIALYYYPDNSTSNKDFYGLLYNWKAVMREEEPSNTVPSGVQGICPEGWHMPSDEEWTVLKDFVGAQAEYRCEGSTQNVLSALADSVGWDSGTYCDCCPGNVENNNATGFSARPAGWWYQGKRDFMTNANFWTSNVINERYKDIMMIISNTAISSTNTWGGASPAGGRSVRCLRD